jgi:hypothetical protein
MHGAQLRRDNHITKTGLRWQHIGALKTIDERNTHANLQPAI